MAAGHGPAAAEDSPSGPEGQVAASTPDGVETGEVARGPVTGLPWRGFRDPATHAKWFVGPGGTAVRDYAAIVAAEEAALTPAERLFGRELAERLADRARHDEEMTVTFVLRRQPVANAAARIRPGYAERLGALAAAVRDALDSDPARADRFRDESRGLVRQMRREILDASREACESDHAALAARIARFPGARIVATSRILSTVTARLRAADLAALASDLGDVASARLAGQRRTYLNTSQGTLGSSTWWSAGYDGTSSTKVAILDTGVDSGHPALSSAVTDEAVFLSSGASQSYFDDDENDPDDIHSHGTHCAGISGSRDSTYLGVAKGAAIMNAKCGYMTTDGGGALDDPDIMDAGDWAADNGADVFSCSFGADSSVTDGSGALSLFFDAVVQHLGITVAISAGNSGSSAGTVGTPADGFNILTVGNFDDKGTTSRSDDAIASSSSRGPLSDGRRKPDISAPGTNIMSSYAHWESAGDFISYSGTSMAAPHVAGAAALLLDLGTATAPEAVKASLMNSVRHASPVPTSPDNNWGWGAMDLTAAYNTRSSVWEGALYEQGNPRFQLLDLGALASGGRVTLAWSRNVTSNGNAAPTSYASLVDLDLFLYDEATGGEVKNSASTLNSVEMVEVSSALTSPVAKIHRAGNPPTSSSQAGSGSIYAGLADGSGAAPVERSGPSLSASFTTLPALVGPGTAFSVAVRVTNGGDLAARATSVTLSLPTGYAFASGQGATVSSLAETASGGTATATFNVVAPASGTSGTVTFAAAVADGSYGETWGASASGTQVYDALPPSGSVTAAGGADWTSSRDISVALSATDQHATVADMQVYVSAAGALVPYATSAALTLSSGDGVKTVRAKFRDSLGNLSGEFTDTVGLDQSTPSGTLRINAGQGWTSTPLVSLDLDVTDSGSGVVEMRFSDDNATWSDWTAFSASSPWPLPGADGIKTVYAEFRDAVGHTASSSDQVGIDRTGPVGSFTIQGGASWTNSRTVTLEPSAADAGIGIADMQFSNDGTTWAPWRGYGGTYTWSLDDADGQRTVWGRFRDKAGNVSQAVTAVIGLDRTKPSGTVLVEGGRAAAGSADVTLSLAASDTGSGVAEYRASTDGITWGAWSPAAEEAAFTLHSGEGVRTAHVQWRDAAGNVSPAATDTILTDFTAPSASMTLDGGRAYSGRWGDPTIAVEADDLSGSGAEAFRWSTDDGTTWTDWLAFGDGAFDLTPPGGASGADIDVTGEVRDVAGNVSEPFTASIFRLRDDAANGTLGKKLTGATVEGEFDAFLIDAMEGDALDVKAPAGIELDIVGPAGESWVVGRFPADAKKGGIKRFVFPATATATLVVRRGDAAPAAYSLSVKLKLARTAPIAFVSDAGIDGEAQIWFDGASSRVLTGTFDGETRGPVRIEMPDGSSGGAALNLTRGSPFPRKLAPATLSGAGRYVMWVPGNGIIGGTGRLAPAKLLKSVAE
ncbi:MAG: hypothetical protein HMLKMBBP_03258 [Planctomycetes bacterium]|nr:hypothetical protein [Planctomycetota bacterium]